jgi:hypothetical protein
MNHFVQKRYKPFMSFTLMLLLFCNCLFATPDCPIVTGRFQHPDGTTSVNSSTGWSINSVAGAGFWAVKSNRLHAQELGGVGIWTSKVFSTTNYSDFKVAVKVSSEGDMNSSEYVKIYYKINGGAETLLDQRTGNFGTIDFTSGLLTGNNVQLVVKIYNYNNGGSQTSKYYIEEYRVFKEHGPCGAPGSITVSASASNSGVITCSNPSVTLSVSSSASSTTYSWTGPGGFTSSSQNPSVSVAGTYNVTGTSSSGSGTASVTITSNQTQPGVSATGGVLACGAGTTINASSAVAGVQYSWTGPGGFASTNQNPFVTTSGTYNVTVTNPANGCTSSQSVQVTGASSTPVTYWLEDFTLANGTCVDNGTTAWSIVNPGSGTYSVQNNEFKTAFSAAAEGIWSSQIIDISAKPNITLSVDLRSETASGSDFLESDDYIRVYYKLNGGAETLVFEDFAGLNGTTAGTASLTVNSASLNGSTLQVIIKTRNSHSTERYFFDNVQLSGLTGSGGSFNVSATNNGPLTCDIREATITGSSSTPGLTYQWVGPFGFTSTSAVFTATEPGAYKLTVTDAVTGCTDTTSTVLADGCKGERRTAPLLPVGAGEAAVTGFKYSMYPNPVTSRSIIEFSHPESAAVSISIYNMTGACVQVLFNKNVTANQTYKLELNGNTLRAGTYYSVMKVNGKVFTRKLVVAK